MKTIILFLLLMAMFISFLPDKSSANNKPPLEDLLVCQVTVNVTLSTGLEAIGTIVTCNGTVDTITSPGEIIAFDIGTSGGVDISAFKIGYDHYISNNMYLECNDVVNIVLGEKKYPPTCLEVDSLTLRAAWCEPLRTALDEDFENSAFPPAGWQAMSHAEGWYRTNDGNNGNWTIPAWDSYYAVTNSSYGDGCCDYLITPAVDLRESEGYALSFDSYYDGGLGELAFVEYSLDGGDTWEILYQLCPDDEWTEQELNLSALSGPEGPEQIMFAFHADDAGGSASGWAVDNIKIQVPDPAANYLDFWVYLNDTLVGVTTETNWDYSPLLYGQTCTASVAARYSSGLSSKDYYTFFRKYLFPPDSLTGIMPDDAAILQWYPPWESWPAKSSGPSPVQLPVNLLGYNIYRDGAFVAYTPHIPPGEYIEQWYVDEDLWPGIYEYTITAVYDLAPYGYPGDTGESMPEGPAEIIGGSCFDLEFLETWSMGTFGDNNWIAESANWSVDSQVGNPSPAAELSGDPVITNYEAALMSYPICAVGMTEGNIWLDFDLKLEAFEPTGEEMIQAQVWNWETSVWNTVDVYSNEGGSFDWTSEHINIKSQAMDKVFRIRFQAMGSNSASILGWFIDNIDVYRDCEGPTNLTATPVPGQGIVLDWDMPGEGSVDQWIHWDNGENSGNSFGSGSQDNWDVAARWDPDQLVNYEGASVTEISFFPLEPAALYKVRLWVGPEAENLVVDQAVTPVCGQWNTVTLSTPVPVDITQDLWIGYNVNTPFGFPVGGDDGPAIDGYGNMINFGGWKTLLQMNPDLDYNWNISAHLMTVDGSRELAGFNFYRSIDGGNYDLIDFTTGNGFVDYDENLIIGSTYCYIVSAVWISETDQCESDFSNEACALWTSIDDKDESFCNFSLYPNPADDHVYLSASVDLQRITIFDATGRLIKDEKTQGKQFETQTSTYTNGVYLVRLETVTGVMTRILTIQR